MTTLEAIIAELKRQREVELAWVPCLDLEHPTVAHIEGSFDLVALADAIDKARNADKRRADDA